MANRKFEVIGVSGELGITVNVNGTYYKPTLKMDLKVQGETTEDDRVKAYDKVFQELIKNLEKQILELTD